MIGGRSAGVGGGGKVDLHDPARPTSRALHFIPTDHIRDTVGQVKAVIQAKGGTLWTEHRLIFVAAQLEDDRAISDLASTRGVRCTW